MAKHTKKVLAFGVFDGLHDGHRYFLSEAKKLGDYLIAVVAHDDAVRKLKNREPRIPMEERAAALRAAALANEVVIGDAVQGSWNVLKNQKVDVIAIGHDQHSLENALRENEISKNIPLVRIGFSPINS